MTGLDAILAQIITDANTQAEAKVNVANERAQIILSERTLAAETLSKHRLEAAAEQAKRIEIRGQSAAKNEKRSRFLTERNRMIDEVLKQSLASLANTSSQEAFEQIEAYVLSCPIDQPASLILSTGDVERIPDGFTEKLSEMLAFPITVNAAPGKFTFGCVVVCGEVEYDGTAEGILYSRRDELRDLVNQILFPEEPIGAS